MHEDSTNEFSAFANKVAGVVLEDITNYFADKAVFQGAEQRLDETQVSKPEQEEEIAEDMLDFAFSMGE